VSGCNPYPPLSNLAHSIELLNRSKIASQGTFSAEDAALNGEAKCFSRRGQGRTRRLMPFRKQMVAM
jgi:hypothetical protein